MYGFTGCLNHLPPSLGQYRVGIWEMAFGWLGWTPSKVFVGLQWKCMCIVNIKSRCSLPRYFSCRSADFYALSHVCVGRDISPCSTERLVCSFVCFCFILFLSSVLILSFFAKSRCYFIFSGGLILRVFKRCSMSNKCRTLMNETVFHYKYSFII